MLHFFSYLIIGLACGLLSIIAIMIRAIFNRFFLIFFSAFICSLLFHISFAQAATCDSTGGTSGTPLTWESTGTWTCGSIPGASDDVTIKNGNYVNITTATGYTVNTFTIESGGTLLHSAQTDTSSAGEWTRNAIIDITATTISIAGNINAQGKGYSATGGGGTGPGYGPGAGTVNSWYYAGGGGHAGAGGMPSDGSAVGGSGNDYLVAPVDAGSGGACGYGANGGAGGGVVKLKATNSGDALSIAGTINVYGNAGAISTVPDGRYGAGGGAGGTVYIDMSGGGNITGTGTINAYGGAGANGGTYRGGGGGGGRIAIVGYGGSLSLTYAYYGGAGPGATTTDGGSGTLVLKASGTDGGLFLDNNGSIDYTRSTMDTTESVTFDNIKIQNGAHFVIPSGARINLDASSFTTPTVATNSSVGKFRAEGSFYVNNSGDSFSIPKNTYLILKSGSTFQSNDGSSTNVDLTLDTDGDAYGSTLSVAHTSGVTTITVVSTTGFPASGTVTIGGEQITYTGTTATTLTGCTRGANGSTAVAHNQNDFVVVGDEDGTLELADYTNAEGSVLTLGSLTVNGKVTQEANASGNSLTDKVRITATTVTIGTNGIIDVDGKGYNGGGRWINGYGTGGGDSNNGGEVGGGGGGYGGAGGAGQTNTAGQGLGGAAYGSALAPVDIGSGGAGGSYFTCSPIAGSGGGGVEFTVTGGGTFTLGGTISANGQAGTGSCDDAQGGGSGGAVYINFTANGTLTGAGNIYASGGSGGAVTDDGGGGGGGRIAIIGYNDISGFSGGTQAYGGAGPNEAYAGAAGTIVKKAAGANPGLVVDNNAISDASGETDQVDASLTFDTVKVQGSAIYDVSGKILILQNSTFTVGASAGTFKVSAGSFKTQTDFTIPNLTTLILAVQSNTLNGALNNSDTTITVNATTGFPSSGTILIDSEQITYTGITSTTFTGCTRGANATSATTHTTSTNVFSGLPSFKNTSDGTLNSLTVASGGTFSQSGYTNSDTAWTVGTLDVQTGGTLNHTDNSTTLARLSKIKISAGTITINGTVDVDYKGYDGGGNSTNGSGSGGGKGAATGETGGGGGAYGGAGGNGQNGSGTNGGGGSTYGSATAPVDIGSGGGGGNYFSCTSAGSGGGAVELAVTGGGTFTLGGIISANGQAGTGSCDDAQGGGSGGSIYINFVFGGIFTGTGGTLRANGGAGGTNTDHGGGGGGGRISVTGYSSDTTSSITETVSAGAKGGGSATAGSAGTTNLTAGNQSPTAPSSLGAAGYVDGSTSYDWTPTLGFTLADADGSDTVKYKIQIDDSADFGSLIVDYTSALAAQGATSFTVGQPAGSGTYTTGSASTVLVAGTSYYWRVKTIDNSAAESSYSTANSGSIAFVIAEPNVSFGTTSQSVSETAGTATVTVNLSAAAGQDVDIPFTMSGSATGSGTDYSVTASPVTIAAGATSTTITLTISNDSLNETDETAIVTMNSPTYASQGTNTVHTVTITDDIFYVTTSGGDTGSYGCTNSGADACTFRRAIEAASSGDTISVAAGNYNLTAAIDPGAKNLTFQGAGLRGSNITKLNAPSGGSIFNFGTAGNTSTIRDFVLLGNGGGAWHIYSSVNASPTIERNIFAKSSYGGIYFTHSSAAPTIQNNIILDTTYYGIYLASTLPVVRNNTVVNNNSGSYEAFYGGTRTNNIAYAGGTGFANCTDDKVKNNLSFRNATDYASGCTTGLNTNNVTNSPRFLNWMENTTTPTSPTVTKNATGFSDSSGGVAAAVITDADAHWTTNQWVGYFVTPDMGRSPSPQYFLITSNTETTLTVTSIFSMTSYGSSGKPYAITDFSFGTNAPGAGTANATILTTDIYGTSRDTQQDIGAVKASGTSTSANVTYHVDTTAGINYQGTGSTYNTYCTTATTPCSTIEYALALAEDGDTIKVANGDYTLSSALALGYGKSISFQGGYSTSDNFATQNVGVRGAYMTRIIGASGAAIFSFDTASNTGTVKNFVLQTTGSSTYGIYSGYNVSPTIENNIILKAYIGIYFTTTSSPTIRNNIVMESQAGIYAGSSGAIISNNTVVNSSGYNAYYQGTRSNNIAYAGVTGFESCVDNTVKNNLAFRNATNYTSGCTTGLNTNNLTDAPRFLNWMENTTTPTSPTVTKNATGFSNTDTSGPSKGVDTAIIRDDDANWTTNQWVGYFVTPNMGRAPYPQYFLITSNTATTLTVTSAFNMTTYGTSGNSYAITDFSFGTNAPGAGTANATILTTDIYGTSRDTQQDIGAVKASGTSTSANATYHVDTTAGINYQGTGSTYNTYCTTATTPCATIEYALALAENGDTIKVAKGNYTLSSALALGYGKSISFQGGYSTSDNFATQNVGVRGAYMTRIIGASGAAIFSFDTASNTGTVKNFVLQTTGSSTYGIYSGNNVSPTIENNVILKAYIGIYFSVTSSPTIQNNIIMESQAGIYAASSGAIIRNNTVVNTSTYNAFYSGTRTNNIAYAGVTGFEACTDNTVKNNLAFRHATDYTTGCTTGLNTNNLTDAPRFLNWMENTTTPTSPTVTKNATGFSDVSGGVAAAIITDADAHWTTNQWVGYFVTPDMGRSPYPQYFLITSNTETTLTVTSGLSLTSYGSSGKPYAITDFSFGTNAPGANTANPTILTTDIYGTTRDTQQDIGAVKASGTSTSASSTYHVDTTAGVNYQGTGSTYNTYCTSATTPCATIEYALALAENGDTIKVAKGTYNLASTLALGYKKSISFKGGYDTADNFATQNVGVRGTYMTRLIAPASSSIFTFDVVEPTTSPTTYNTSLIQNFVLQGNGGTSFLINGSSYNVSPTIEKNIITKISYGAIYIQGLSAAPVIQNNIMVDFTYYGPYLASSNGLVTNNTAVSGPTATYQAYYKGTRKNNIAYGTGIAYDSCGSYGNTTYSHASSNATGFNTGCDNGNNSTAAPQFTDTVSTTSNTVAATTLTKTGAGWTENQWTGYFVTPNLAATTPRYFFIVSNTTDTLTVASTVNMTDYGSSGNTFQITDFTLKSASALRDAGTNTGAPATDIYGNARPQNTTTDMGATEYVPPPGVTLSRSPATLAESGGTSTVTATLSGTYTDTVTVNLSYSGTATDTSDYTSSSASIVITAGNTTGTVTLTGVSDTLDESDETIVVDIDSVINATETGTQQATATITDDDAAPTVTLSVISSPLAENAGTATVRATLSAVSGQDVTVDLSYSGTATNSTDYTRSATQIIIAAGNLTNLGPQDITLTGVNDALDETDETVIVDISGVTNGTESGTQQVTATITDDDAAPTVTLAVDNATIVENVGVATFTATLSAASGKTVTVDLAYTGTATGSGTDYTASGTSITINAGSTTGTRTVTSVNDTLDENDETVIVDISGITNGDESGTQQQTTTITDDDAAPTVTLSVLTSPFAENAGTALVRATLSTASGKNVTVDLSYAGTAINTTDYTRSSSQIVITAGNTTENDITLTGVNDSLNEATETVIADIIGVTNGTESGTQQVTASITDDDSAPTITLSLDATPLTEAGGIGTVTATLSAVSGQDVTVNLALSGTATDTTDYSKSASSINISAGATTGTITLTSISDDLAEDDETIIVDVTTVDNATESGTQQVTATITDNDSAGITLTQSSSSTDVTEGSTTDTYTLVLTSQPTADVTITITGAEDAGVNLASLTFNSGNWNIAQTITVTAVDDDIAEGNHTGIITHATTSTDPNYNLVPISDVAANIVDNDSAGISITPSGGTTEVTEGGSTDTYTVVLTSEPVSDVAITLTPADTTNGVTVDAGILTFTSADWDTPQIITVTAADDLIAEGSQAVLITHVSDSSDTDYQDIPIADVSAAITDNDAQGVTLAESEGTTILGDAEASDEYTFVLTSQPTANVVITPSAEAGLDVIPANLTFTEDNWDIAQAITVTADETEFGEDETNKTITHSISSSDTNYQNLTLSSVLVILTAQEETPEEAPPTEDDTLTANAGADRTMTSGISITLNGTASTGDILSYSWVLVSGCGSLADITSATPTYTAPASDCTGNVEIELTVTNALSETATDRAILHIIEKAQVSIETVEGAAVMSQSNGYTVYENHEEDVTTLAVGNAQIELPNVNEMGDYTVAVTHEGYFVICFPAFQGGRCYVSKIPVGQLSGNISLGDTDVTVQGLSKSQGTEYFPLAPKTASTSAEFNTVTSTSQSDDLLGSYIATGDINGDGEDEILLASPGAGNYGILYIYNLNTTLIGTVFGSETYPIQSVLVSNYISSLNEDVIFGPDNPALNQSLRSQSALVATAKNDFGFLLNGTQSLETSTDLSVAEVNAVLGRGASYQSIALGDLNNDGADDLIMGSDNGYAYIYFGPVENAADLTTDDANVIIAGSSSEGFGQMIATGDVSGDGIDDLMIGAPSYGSSLEGAVYVIYGTTNWDAAIDVTTSAQVMILSGATANGQIGSDLIIADLESTGTSDIYTVDTNDAVIRLSLSGGSSTATDDGAASFGGSLAGNGCQLNTSIASPSKLFWELSFIFIVIFSLRKLKMKQTK